MVSIALRNIRNFLNAQKLVYGNMRKDLSPAAAITETASEKQACLCINLNHADFQKHAAEISF
jgi:hypothetical protein